MQDVRSPPESPLPVSSLSGTVLRSGEYRTRLLFLVRVLILSFFALQLTRASGFTAPNDRNPTVAPTATFPPLSAQLPFDVNEQEVRSLVKQNAVGADGKEILNHGLPQPVKGENANFGKTGSANFSWMLEQEPQPVPRAKERIQLAPKSSPPAQ
jgi:hypothetical protein